MVHYVASEMCFAINIIKIYNLEMNHTYVERRRWFQISKLAGRFA